MLRIFQRSESGTDGLGGRFPNNLISGGGRAIAVATGFLFVGEHTNTLTLDGFGNLWIGDDTSEGTVNFTGRLWRVPVALLRMLFRELIS